MKIKLKSRNFEKLQRFSAFSTKSGSTMRTTHRYDSHCLRGDDQ